MAFNIGEKIEVNELSVKYDQYVQGIEDDIADVTLATSLADVQVLLESILKRQKKQAKAVRWLLEAERS